jgi:flagellar assembly protein FliH
MTLSSDPKPAHHYQRFIPREEVQQVSAWEFESMDGSRPRGSAAAAEPEKVELTQELRDQIYAEGFEHGRQAGAQETRQALAAPMQQQAREQAQRMAELLQRHQGELDRLQDQLAQQVLELACDLARQVVRRELQQPLAPLRAVVQEALSLAIEDARPAMLRLHPGDLTLLQADLGEWLQGQPVRLLPDPGLTPGGCLVESAQGTVDGTLERRWARAVGNLGLDLPWAPEDTNHG